MFSLNIVISYNDSLISPNDTQLRLVILTFVQIGIETLESQIGLSEIRVPNVEFA